MKKIIILSCFIAFAFVILIPRSFIFAAEETENYETAIDKVADAYIGKSVPGAWVTSVKWCKSRKRASGQSPAYNL